MQPLNDFDVSQVDTFPDAVFFVDRNRTIIWANDLASSFFTNSGPITGKDLREVLGKSRFDLVWSVFEMQFAPVDERAGLAVQSPGVIAAEDHVENDIVALLPAGLRQPVPQHLEARSRFRIGDRKSTRLNSSHT